MGRAKLLSLTTLVFVLLATGGLGVISNKSALAADKGSWKNVSLLYLSDVKGKIDPCG